MLKYLLLAKFSGLGVPEYNDFFVFTTHKEALDKISVLQEGSEMRRIKLIEWHVFEMKEVHS